MFARYSRYAGTFDACSWRNSRPTCRSGERPFDGVEGERAAGLYERVFIGYGDDSIGSGGRRAPRLRVGLERPHQGPAARDGWRPTWSSPPATSPTTSRCPGAATATTATSPSASPMRPPWTSCSESTPRSLESVQSWAAERWPRGEEPEAAWRRSIRAKALDLLRGVLPAATLSHVGIFASGQAYEQLLLRLMASPLPEAREFGGMILGELAKVIPSFVARVERPDRGGEWIAYLQERRRGDRAHGGKAGAGPPSGGRRALGRAGRASTAARGSCSRPRCSRRRASRRPRYGAGSRPSTRSSARELIAELAGERRNRRHRPGRGWEAVRYRFEIVSDYGGFRDLQRHRMLTCQWQRLGPDLGAGIPEEVRDAGIGPDYERALEISRRRVRPARGRGTRTRLPRTRSASATGSATCST